jgi:hypothetical protein
VTCGQKWLAQLTPFFSAREREQAGCQHRLFFSQVEFCDNLIFRRRAALTCSANACLMPIEPSDSRTRSRSSSETEIEDMNLPNPVVRSRYGNGFIKQYVRDHLILRTEAASNNGAIAESW